MSDRPTIHLTNWSSLKLHGDGRMLTIMARPRQWEHGEGRVYALTPDPQWVIDAKAGKLALADYRRLYEAKLSHILDVLTPETLAFHEPHTGRLFPVHRSDTLCCSCSKAAAARGECHRVWAASALVRAGWRVVLDGKEVTA